MTRRDLRLDRLLGRLVTITFHDGEKRTGVLEFGIPYAPGLPDSNYYSLYEFGEGRIRFRKSAIKMVKAK